MDDWGRQPCRGRQASTPDSTRPEGYEEGNGDDRYVMAPCALERTRSARTLGMMIATVNALTVAAK